MKIKLLAHTQRTILQDLSKKKAATFLKQILVCLDLDYRAKQILHLSILICLITSFTNCKDSTNNTKGDAPLINTQTKNYHLKKNTVLKYAKGFSISSFKDYTLLEINKPWQNSDSSFKYALINMDNVPKAILNEDELDGVVTTSVQKIVVTSTTHIPALELLGVEQTLVGFPGTNYISSKKTRQLIDDGFIRELGKNEEINIEVLMELKPDVVIGFGVNGINKTFVNIQKANIPVIYNGDWIESSPLAKAEWIKFFGVLFNKEKEADSIFNTIETNYLETKQLAYKAQKTPTILSGAIYKDIWYLPNGTSIEAQLLKDANTNYLWSDTKGTGSLSLNFETVFNKGKYADIWLNPSNYESLEALEKANSHYTKFKAFKTKQVYSFNNTIGKTGGVLYYELGTARPDLVLKDIIKISHPELLKDYQPYFFKPLE